MLIKKLFNTKLHLRFLFNPIIRIFARNLGDFKYTNCSERDIPIVVSLTSYEDRFKDLEISLYSLLTQSLKPDRIILWLSDEIKSINDIPYEITRYIKNGLEIRFVKDIGSYTKAIYAFKEFSDCIIVTADDDIYYPKHWLSKLYHSYIAHPDDIQVHRAHRAEFDADTNRFFPYENWEKHTNKETADYNNFLTGVGGALYPPNCFSNEVLRKDVFLKHAPYADDIWFWVMAIIHNRKIRVVKNHINTLTCTNIFRQIFNSSKSLYAINVNGHNDKQLDNLLSYYGQNVYNKVTPVNKNRKKTGKNSSVN